MLASWAMASLVVVLHVYSSLNVPPLGDSQTVQEAIQAMRKNPDYFKCQSLAIARTQQYPRH